MFRHEGACLHCKNGFHRGTVPVGQQVDLIEDANRAGIGEIEHRFSQCRTCGSLWVEIIDNRTMVGKLGPTRYPNPSYARFTNDIF